MPRSINSQNGKKGVRAGEIQVIHIDDEPDFLELSSGFVERESDRIEVTTVTEPSEVLDRIEEVDCVVSDYKMPGMGGLELLEEVRERAPGIPFILFTGRGSEEVASEAISAGVTGYLPKGGTEKYELLANRIEKAAEGYSIRKFEQATKQKPFSMLERVSDAFYALDTDWRFTYLNDEASDMFGDSHSELLGECIWERFPEARETPFYDHYTEAMNEQEPRVIEEPFEPWDRWYMEYLYPSEDGLSVISRDITDRKDRERELERYEAFIQNSYDSVTHIDSGGNILYQSPSVERMLGYDNEKLLGENAFDYVHPEDEDRLLGSLTDLIQGDRERTRFGDFRLRHSDGHYVWLEAVGTDQTGSEFGGIIVNSRDVTEKKSKKEQLQRSHDLLHHTERLAGAGGWEIDVGTGEQRWTEGTYAIHEIPSGSDFEPTVDSGIGFYHPEDRGRVERAIKNCIDGKESFDESLRLITQKDRLRWVRTVGEPVVNDGEVTEIRGAIRDITEQKRYQDSLEGINRQTDDLLQAGSDEEIAETVVDVATDILGIPVASVHIYDEELSQLVPVALSDETDVLGDVPSYSPGEGIAWEAFADGQMAVFDDVRNTEDAYGRETRLRSEAVSPLGERGVLIMGDTEVGVFGSHTVELIEILTATAEEALDRAERTRRLREKRKESKNRAEKLTRVHQLNEEIRTLNRSLIQGESSEGIKASVCESLTNLGSFGFAWVGEPDRKTDELKATASGGKGREYLEDVSLRTEAENDLPSVVAAERHETTVEDRIGRNIQSSEWKNTALVHGFRSVLSVPLVHEGVLYGVLGIYSDETEAFDDLTVSVLKELGQLVGYALSAVEQRNALMSESTASLTFEFTEPEDAFVGMSSELDADIEVVNITKRSESTSAVQFSVDGTVTDTDKDEVVGTAEDMAAVREIKPISDPSRKGRLLFEGVVVGELLVTEMLGMGAKLSSLVVSGGSYRVTLTVPSSRDKRELVERLRKEYPEAKLKSNYNGKTPGVSPDSPDTSELTERQEEIQRTAYHSGYFDRDRKKTGSEVADSLGISQPAFSKQLRTAQEKLLGSVYGDGR